MVTLFTVGETERLFFVIVLIFAIPSFSAPVNVLIDELVVLRGDAEQTIVENLDLLLDSLVGPLAVKMVVLNGHEAAHTPIEFLIPHLLQRIGLEVGMVEHSGLHFSNEYDQEVSQGEVALISVLFETEALG